MGICLTALYWNVYFIANEEIEITCIAREESVSEELEREDNPQEVGTATDLEQNQTVDEQKPGAEDQQGSTGEDKGEGLESQLRLENEDLKTQLSELKDQYLRQQADFDNMRKRLRREKEEGIAYANHQILEDLVAIIDDFERAIRSSEESRDFDAFHDGIALIERQFTSMLERKWGLKRIEAEGMEFDPNVHEAVTAEPREDHETQMVLEDFQRGYMLNDRVLRTSKVKVSIPGKGE